MKIKDAKVYTLSDIATAAQAKVQAAFPDIDPIIGISHNLRESGFAADTMTIQNHKTDKRILLVLHDEAPDTVDVEFGKISKDPTFQFETYNLQDMTEELFVDWMSESLT